MTARTEVRTWENPTVGDLMKRLDDLPADYRVYVEFPGNGRACANRAIVDDDARTVTL